MSRKLQSWHFVSSRMSFFMLFRVNLVLGLPIERLIYKIILSFGGFEYSNKPAECKNVPGAR